MKRIPVRTGVFLLCVLAAHAQVPTSRQIPFNGVATTIAPSTPGQTLTIQLWDAATGGNQLYCENQTLDVDANGAITFNFGAGTAPTPPCASAPPGLDPNNFPSGASRFLDVVDSTGTSVLPNPPGRIPLNAAAFALSPGPEGPPGPQGPPGQQGPPGPPGVVQAVGAGDSSIVVGGTAANPTVAVANSGITTAKLAANAVTSANLAVPLTLSGSTGGGGSIIQATNSGNGQGLSGFATAANGGIGVIGVGLSGVQGFSGANFGLGVAGQANAGTGVSGFGQTGVSGSSTIGTGVSGNSSAPNGIAVSGNATGSGGTGVRGSGQTGVSGTATAAGGFGIVGSAGPAGSIAGQFNGSVNVTGGNVGIGTASPISPLEVNGVVRGDIGVRSGSETGTTDPPLYLALPAIKGLSLGASIASPPPPDRLLPGPIR